MCSVYIYEGIAGEQKGVNFSASFNAFPLVVCEKMATLHTHTHTHTHTICAPIGSVILFHFFLRARETRVIPIGKGLSGVPFASLFMPTWQGRERENNKDFHS